MAGPKIYGSVGLVCGWVFDGLLGGMWVVWVMVAMEFVSSVECRWWW